MRVSAASRGKPAAIRFTVAVLWAMAAWGLAAPAPGHAAAPAPAAASDDLGTLDDTTLQQAIAAQPRRGDLQLERIRRLLGRGDTALAQSAWADLQRLQPPEGIRALVERWFEQAAAARLAAEALPAAPGRERPRHQIQLGAGWDSNPTLGASSPVLQLGGDALGQVLRLAASALPQPSPYASLQVDGQSAPLPALGQASAVYGASYSHFSASDFEREYLAYAGMASGDRACPIDLAGSTANSAPLTPTSTAPTPARRCGASLLLAHGEVREQDYTLASLRGYLRGAGGLEFGASLGGLYRLGQTESAQTGIDLQRRWDWRDQHLLLRGDVQWDAALGGRAGGDQWRYAVQLGWDSPAYAWGARLLLRHARDSEPFASALLGSAERQQTLWRAELERRFVIDAASSWAVFARHERTSSNITLFESDRSVLGVTLRRLF